MHDSIALMTAAVASFDLDSETFTIAMLQGSVQDALAHAWISWRAEACCPACGRSQAMSRFMPSDCSHGDCLTSLWGYEMLPQCSLE